jgi:hypothetical protein
MQSSPSCNPFLPATDFRQHLGIRVATGERARLLWGRRRRCLCEHGRRLRGPGHTTWHTLIGRPPSSQHMGRSPQRDRHHLLRQRRTDAVAYERITSGMEGCAPGAQRSTDEDLPAFLDCASGLALVSGGADGHWFKTIDGGITWQALNPPEESLPLGMAPALHVSRSRSRAMVGSARSRGLTARRVRRSCR